MKKTLKRILAVLCVCTTLFSISGCVSTANTDNAKSLSGNSSYNIDEHKEESVKIDLNTGMAFSEKGSVRFEDDIELVDFWEYGSKKSNTIYFEALENDILESYPNRTSIEFAFEYKDMIYFLKKTFDKLKNNKYDFTLYRTTLNGKDITKISTVVAYKLEREDELLYTDYYIDNVFVENNSLIFTIQYYDEDASQNITEVQKIDLKTGVSKSLLKETEMSLVDVRVNNDFTYLYLNSFLYLSQKPKVYKVDNNTNKSSVIEYNFGDMRRTEICVAYEDSLICRDINIVSLVSTDKKPITIYDGANIAISNIYLSDNNVIINLDDGESFYSYNLETGKQNIYDDTPNDLSRAVHRLGDKYLCYLEQYDEDNYFSTSGYYGYECYCWSSVEDVEANKHNLNKIKNQSIVSDTYVYSYVYDEFRYEDD